jgi:hypothetical protein
VAVAVVALVGVGVLIGHAAQLGVAASLVFVSAVALAAVRELVMRAEAPARAAAVTTEPRPALEQLREVAKAVATVDGARPADRSLQALLRPIVSARLDRRGVDLDRDAVQARALLGDDLWEIVRRGGGEPFRGAGRVSVGELEQMVERLETI